DVERTRELLLGIRVDLREGDVGVLLARGLEDRAERLARSAPGRPEVDEHDVALQDGVLEGAAGEFDGRHDSRLGERRDVRWMAGILPGALRFHRVSMQTHGKT